MTWLIEVDVYDPTDSPLHGELAALVGDAIAVAGYMNPKAVRVTWREDVE